MPRPSSSQSSLRPELGSFMEFDLEASRMGFIGLQVMPVLEVGKQAGNFGKITLESLLTARKTNRAPGTGYARAEYEFTTDSFATEEHGAEEPVDDRESEMYSDFFSAEVMATRRARDVVLRNFETRVASALFNTSTFTPTVVATDWDTIASSVPVTDVEARVVSLFDKGVEANCLIVPWKRFRKLRRTTQITDLIAASGAGRQIEPANITAAMLSEVFDLPFIIVAGAQKNNANEGQAASLTTIWDNDLAAVGRIALTNDIREVCVGRTFHWGEDGSTIGTLVETYRDETVRSDITRARMDTDEKVIYTDAWELLDLKP